ncbi:SDR family oxidoreductase [Tuberibacillus sp. Marseille-P3662]|uniref:SDR family oxidoreductase n=1 Tax=Tuberibacillus sp. Marseille-P3662 TaxID=1965358 RepID=UPI000A1CD757|nr:SDR family oxidoreductase [Tuberibacillus sp. Marseille-P3662]
MHINELFNLSGRNAIVTGGGRGLGEQMAIALAEAGANVVVCSRKLEACVGVSEKLKALNVKSIALACDVTDPDAVEHVVQTTVDELGSVDILVNNSGASWGAPALEMPLDAWQKVMNVNATGTFLMTQAAGKRMVDQGGGKIINIASIAGLLGTDPEVLNAVGYHASKGAVVAMTKDFAVKLAKNNVHVNTIAPGFFPTKMTKVVIEQGKDKLLDYTPLGRLGNDDDVKGAVVYLASKASDYVTGHVLTIDGGTHAM